MVLQSPGLSGLPRSGWVQGMFLGLASGVWEIRWLLGFGGCRVWGLAFGVWGIGFGLGV